MKEMKYKDIRDNLKTGDIVGFDGKGLIGAGIKFFSRGKYSHIGIVVRKEDMKLNIENYRKGAVLLLESTTLGNTKDILKNKHVTGVQLVYLSDKIENYKGSVYIKPVRLKRDIDFIANLNAFILKHIHKPYERSFMELLLCCVSFINPKENLKSLFCSELVAEFLQMVNIIPSVFKSNSFSPTAIINYKFKQASEIVKVHA